jgi:hypothetical protein
MSENTVHDVANRLLASPKKSPSVYYGKKLDYQEARVKELLLKRPACSILTPCFGRLLTVSFRVANFLM